MLFKCIVYEIWENKHKYSLQPIWPRVSLYKYNSTEITIVHRELNIIYNIIHIFKLYIIFLKIFFCENVY